MSIYGCGIAIANRIYQVGVFYFRIIIIFLKSDLFFKLGYKTVNSLRENYSEPSLNIHGDIERLKYGLTYYDDLSVKHITLDESKFLFDLLKDLILSEIDKECHVELMGGFRRGKEKGHDLE